MTVFRSSDFTAITVQSGYPEPCDDAARRYTAFELTNAVRLTRFPAGVKMIDPGGVSSQRHWREDEDEFLRVISGEIVHVESDGGHVLRAGDAAGWKAGEPHANQRVNRSDADAGYMIFGTRAAIDHVRYPDIDPAFVRDEKSRRFTRMDGTVLRDTNIKY